jgi:hypothetical protein
MAKLIIAFFTVFITLLGGATLLAHQESAPSAPSPADSSAPVTPRARASSLPFDGTIFERVLTNAQSEPVFVDIDTGRWMTPPRDLLVAENRGKAVDEWAFSDKLQRWIRGQGIDLAVQTDGRSVTLVGFDLRVGKAFRIADNLDASFVAKLVATAQPHSSELISFRRRVFERSFDDRIPFITREGGLGLFWTSVFPFDFRGHNSIRFDYKLARDTDVPKLTGQPVATVFEPMIVRQFSQALMADVRDRKLCLRLPGAAERIEIRAGELVVRSPRGVELRAARLNTGTLDIDAQAGRALIFGRGKEATIRRKDNQVQIEMEKKVTETDDVSFWMPELKIVNETGLKWRSVGAEKPL